MRKKFIIEVTSLEVVERSKLRILKVGRLEEVVVIRINHFIEI